MYRGYYIDDLYQFTFTNIGGDFNYYKGLSPRTNPKIYKNRKPSACSDVRTEAEPLYTYIGCVTWSLRTRGGSAHLKQWIMVYYMYIVYSPPAP